MIMKHVAGFMLGDDIAHFILRQTVLVSVKASAEYCMA